jgi:replicative DNA helicase
MNLPASIDAERALIGCLLFDGQALHRVREKIGVDDFYLGPHQILFRAIEEMVGDDKPLDFVSLTEKLDAEGNLGKVKAFEIAEMIESTPTAANIMQYAEIVRDKATLRKFVLGYQTVLEACKGGEIDKVTSLMREMIDESEDGGGFQTMQDAAFEAQQDFGKLLDENVIGLSFGIPTLDKRLFGARPGKDYVIAAETGGGKTAFACQVAANFNAPGLYVPVEGKGPDVASRMILRELDGYDQYDIAGGVIPFHKIVTAAETVGQSKLLFYKATKFDAIMSGIHTAVKVHGCKFIVIDYLQRIECNFGKTIREKTLFMSHSFANLASDLDIPILILAQINREAEKENRPPRKSDLQESSAIEQDADVVMFIYKQVDKKTGNISQFIKIAKNRQGKTGTIPVEFDPKRQIFTEQTPIEFGNIPPGYHWEADR